MPEIIVSKENKKIKEALKLKDGKGEFFLVEGFHLVEMAIKHNLAKTVFFVKEKDVKGTKAYLVNQEVIKKLSSTVNPEGIVAICQKKKMEEVSGKKVLFLDAVQDPGNVGTLLRTALAFGYKDVILGRGCASSFSFKTIMASQGAIFSLNIIDRPSDPLQEIEGLKEKGHTIIATALKDSLPIEKLKRLDDKFVLVLGNEGKGIRKEIIDISDLRIHIPIEGIDSLNVGVAGGIAMYCLDFMNN